MEKPITNAAGYDKRNLKNNLRIIGWSLAWIGSMVLLDKAVLYQWYSSSAISLLGIFINVVLGLVVLTTFMRFLRDLDDLQRKIQLDALAVTMGVTYVGSMTYSLLVTTGFITDAEVSDMIVLMALVYIAGTIAGQLRYR